MRCTVPALRLAAATSRKRSMLLLPPRLAGIRFVPSLSVNGELLDVVWHKGNIDG
jgi:hypothetical protein